MTLFGTKGIKSFIDQGQFICPQCADTRSYKHKKVTQFFTFLFIPVLPTRRLGDYIECQTCKGTFVSQALAYDPAKNQNEFQAQYEQAMRHSMILMMLADGIIEDDEMAMVQKIINKYGHHDISMDELNELVTQVRLSKEPVSTYLSKITPSLNEHGKETIIKCGLEVAHSDGHFDEAELAMIHEMGEVMEMSKSHLKDILLDMTPFGSDN